jgi:hypothetical protein
VEIEMRYAMLGLLGLMSAGAVVTSGASPAAAFDYPYCLQGKDTGIPGECDYPSYGACQAAASGRGMYCGVNPRVAYLPPAPESRHHGRRYRYYSY